MQVHLSLAHATLLRGNFTPLNFSPIGLKAPGGLTLGSAANF